MDPEHNYKVDVLIIGGGIAGCTAAIALARSYNILMIDKLREPNERIGECLAPAAKRILKKLDLLNEIEDNSKHFSQEMYIKSNGTLSYWGSDRVQVVDHLRNPDGYSWHLDRRAFEAYLRQSAMKRGVNCIWNTKLYSSSHDGTFWQIKVKPDEIIQPDDFHTIKARFVIDASGRQSHFARSIGIERIHFDKLIATWAVVADKEQYQMSTISSGRSGWWYSAPLPDKRRIITFQTDSDLIDRKSVRDADSFIKLVSTNREMARLLQESRGEFEFCGTVSANSTRLKQVAGRQWVALGDAAMSFDPLSSQGMLNAMATAMQLTELMHEHDFILQSDFKKMCHLNDKFGYLTDRIWEHYVKHKRIFYSGERRWKDSAFWKRRHQPHLTSS